MYIPPFNLMDDSIEIIEFIKKFSFGTIITANNNYPIATHLPFLVKQNKNTIILQSHFAIQNKQWKNIENLPVLVIFSEPHAYISPKNYEKEVNVPTWNYISVHCYGKVTLVTQPKSVVKLLEDTIENYEKDYKKQWNNLPENYKSGLVKGIVAFEIIVNDIQGKKKLSQNKNETERKNIINSLSKCPDTNANQIAEYMKIDLKNE